MSNSLWPHEPQHARPPCPSPTARVHPNPCSSSRWCHSTIPSSVVPLSSYPQSFPASGSFQMSQLFSSVAKVLERQPQHQSFQWIFMKHKITQVLLRDDQWSRQRWDEWVLETQGIIGKAVSEGNFWITDPPKRMVWWQWLSVLCFKRQYVLCWIRVLTA